MNSYPSINKNAGFTLLEVLIGLAIFTACIVPLTAFSMRLASAGKIQDLQIAYMLLNSETNIIYKNHKLPEPERKIKMGDIIYSVFCDSKPDSMLTNWSLRVEKNGRKIHSIKGVLFSATPEKL